MKHTLAAAMVVCAVWSVQAGSPKAKVGEPAPGFSLSAAGGKTVSLADHKGSFVVLEWTNLDCPFVRKHYGSGNMQALQKKWTGRKVVWLSINSSAKGKQGQFAPDELEKRLKKAKPAHTAYLLDTDGTVGTLYGAKATPHMFIIDPEGVLIYAGAIDDKPSTDQADVKKAVNYVDKALTAAMDGKKVDPSATKSYGCSVKYDRASAR